MAKVLHTCTGCVPIDASIIETYIALINTNENAKRAESGRIQAEESRVENETARVSAEAARVSAEEERVGVASADHATAVSDHGISVSDHSVAVADHTTAVSDHETAAEDHISSTSATTRANAAAAEAEHMVDIKTGPAGIKDGTFPVTCIASGDLSGTATVRNRALSMELNGVMPSNRAVFIGDVIDTV